MQDSLDYDKLILLDAEALAEGGLADAYGKLRDALRNYIPPPAETAEMWEELDPDSPSYSVTCSGFTYEIYSQDQDEGESWGVATFALFDIVNRQLEHSTHRLYTINGGNDLGALFLTPSEAEAARKFLERPEDWPYLPTRESPWFGQHHSS